MAMVKVIKNILIESNSFLNRKTVNNLKHVVTVILQLKEKIQNNTPIEIEKGESTVVSEPFIELMLKDSQKQKAK